jgi:acetate kinase
VLLVVNTGSSSVKAALFRPDLSEVAAARVTGIGRRAPRLEVAGEARPVTAPDHSAALAALLPVLDGRGEITAAAHRIVHGGETLTAPARLTPEVLARIEACVPLAPLHNPPGLAAIRALAAARPELPQCACFDTAFHAGQPEVETAYALPPEWHARGLRRYGFHGLSYAGLVARMGADLPPRLLALHLGAGVSLCAIRDGRSVATTMGYSPLSGPPMASRCGDIDGMAVLRLAREAGVEAAARLLNHGSGLTGLAGSGDMAALLARDDAEARFAVDHFVHHVVRQAGALVAAMGGVDALAFTGGVGENAPDIRRRIAGGLAFLGPLALHVIPAEEERQIARDAFALLDRG